MSAVQNVGTLIDAPIVPRFIGDPYPSHYDRLGSGGLQTNYANLADLQNNFPPWNKTQGTLAPTNDGNIYQLAADKITWAVPAWLANASGSLSYAGVAALQFAPAPADGTTALLRYYKVPTDQGGSPVYYDASLITADDGVMYFAPIENYVTVTGGTVALSLISGTMYSFQLQPGLVPIPGVLFNVGSVVVSWDGAGNLTDNTAGPTQPGAAHLNDPGFGTLNLDSSSGIINLRTAPSTTTGTGLSYTYATAGRWVRDVRGQITDAQAGCPRDYNFNPASIGTSAVVNGTNATMQIQLAFNRTGLGLAYKNTGRNRAQPALAGYPALVIANSYSSFTGIGRGICGIYFTGFGNLEPENNSQNIDGLAARYTCILHAGGPTSSNPLTDVRHEKYSVIGNQLYTGNAANPAVYGTSSATAWDPFAKSLWMSNDLFYSEIYVDWMELGWNKGEHVYCGGGSLGLISITNSLIHDTNGDGRSTSSPGVFNNNTCYNISAWVVEDLQSYYGYASTYSNNILKGNANPTGTNGGGGFNIGNTADNGIYDEIIISSNSIQKMLYFGISFSGPGGRVTNNTLKDVGANYFSTQTATIVIGDNLAFGNDAPLQDTQVAYNRMTANMQSMGTGVFVASTVPAYNVSVHDNESNLSAVGSAIFQASVAAGTDVLVVSSVSSGTILVGTIITGFSIPAGTTITGFVSGTSGGVGSYTISYTPSSPLGSTTVTSNFLFGGPAFITSTYFGPTCTYYANRAINTAFNYTQLMEVHGFSVPTGLTVVTQNRPVLPKPHRMGGSYLILGNAAFTASITSGVLAVTAITAYNEGSGAVAQSLAQGPIIPDPANVGTGFWINGGTLTVNTIGVKQQLTNTNPSGLAGYEGTYSLSGSPANQASGSFSSTAPNVTVVYQLSWFDQRNFQQVETPISTSQPPGLYDIVELTKLCCQSNQGNQTTMSMSASVANRVIADLCISEVA